MKQDSKQHLDINFCIMFLLKYVLFISLKKQHNRIKRTIYKQVFFMYGCKSKSPGVTPTTLAVHFSRKQFYLGLVNHSMGLYFCIYS